MDEMRVQVVPHKLRAATGTGFSKLNEWRDEGHICATCISVSYLISNRRSNMIHPDV